jgi:hypothetical protein
LDHLRRGELHLSGVKLLAPHPTAENHVELLERARHRSKRAIEALLADRAPKPDAAALVRRLPQSKPTAGAPLAPRDSGSSRPAAEPARAADSRATTPLPAAPISPASATRPPSRAPQPLGQERFKIQFTASRALCQKLREAQALLRHQIPSGDLAEIFGRALTLLVEDIELRCRAHNHHAAVQDYGAAHMERCRGSGRKNTQPRTRPEASFDGG